jgi:hypothetical protein
MIQRDLIDHDRMLECFQSAKDIFAYDARADELRMITRNLHTVERDMLLAPESEIDLPSWN